MQRLDQEDRSNVDLSQAVEPEIVCKEHEPRHQDPVFVVLREEDR